MSCRHPKGKRQFRMFGGILTYMVRGNHRWYEYRCGNCGEIHQQRGEKEQ